MLKNVKNRIGIILGDYRCYKECPMLPKPMTQKVILQLDISYADGTNYTLVSDDSFKAFESPLLFSATTFGEIYDARKEIPDWCNPEFDDSKWLSVSVVSAPEGKFRKSDCPGVIKYDEKLGFAQQVKDGMTTLAERYAYATQAIMSLNHHYLSHVDTWFFKWIAGIKINGFGYDNVLIEPSFVKGIDKVKANLHGIRVEYDKKQIKIDSPYPFTLKFKNFEKRCNAGKYEFSLTA